MTQERAFTSISGSTTEVSTKIRWRCTKKLRSNSLRILSEALLTCVLQTAARDEILACGGSISHHHGVGKLRKRWIPSTIGEVGVSLLRAMKKELDPTNTFANNNLIDLDRRSKL